MRCRGFARTDLYVSGLCLGTAADAPVRHERHHRSENREQLSDDLAASDVALTPDPIARLDSASAPPVEYPGWMDDWQRRGRRPAAV